MYSWELWKKLGLTNRNGKTSHMHTHAHMLISIHFKSKNRMNIGLTYFWKGFRWIGVDRVCMLISQLLLLYIWEAFTHTHFAYVLDSLAMWEYFWEINENLLFSLGLWQVMKYFLLLLDCVIVWCPLWTNLLVDNMWSIC